MEKMLVKGVAKDDDVERISICNIEDKPGMAFKVFSLLASKKINVDIILQSIGREGKKDISFTVNEDNLEKAVEVLNSGWYILGEEVKKFEEDVLPALSKEIELTKALNCKVCVLHLSIRENKEVSQKYNIQRLSRLIPVAEKHGVILAIENTYNGESYLR